MKLSDLLDFDGPVAIQCHNVPDADAMASGYALWRYFHAHGKRPLFFHGGPPISKPNLLWLREEISIPIEHRPDLKEWNGMLITVDCQHGAGNVARVELGEGALLVVIDHHVQERPLPPLHDLRPWLGSCATLVWDMLRTEDFALDRCLSTALYYGLFTDTNAFAEICHPLDRDMWDSLSIDEDLVRHLRLSNVELRDLGLVAEALGHIQANDKLHFALVQAPPCDPNLLGVISDLTLECDGIDMVVVHATLLSGDVKFSVRTATREAKAAELAGWLTAGIGSGGGHRDKAGGFIAAQRFAEQHPGEEIGRYLREQTEAYCRAFRILDCEQPLSIRAWLDLDTQPDYCKLPVVRGFVPCSRLFSAGSPLQLRMLEGDMDVEAGEDTVLMIGVMGEVYPTNHATFTSSYHALGTPYTPALELRYEPTVLDRRSGKRIALLEHAEACMSAAGGVVKAHRLTERVKVFTRWDKGNYFAGGPGDWLVGRATNGVYDDVYVVTADVFALTYARDLTRVDMRAFAHVRAASKKPLPLQVSFATSDGVLHTLEGPVAYRAGDALLIGKGSEQWPVERAYFERRYTPEAGGTMGEAGRYIPLPLPVQAVQVDEPFAVSLSGKRGLLQGNAGDWLVEYAPGERGIVARDVFAQTYNLG